MTVKKFVEALTDSFLTSKILRFTGGASMLKGKEYMTGRQKALAEEFEAGIELEYALCTAQLQKAKQAIEWSAADLGQQHQNLANSEMDALRKYWHDRLETLVELASWRAPKLLQQLNEKYPNNQEKA
jgi:hypothetical protein